MRGGLDERDERNRVVVENVDYVTGSTMMKVFISHETAHASRRSGRVIVYPLMGTDVPPQQLAFFATQHGVSWNWVEQHLRV